MSMIPEIKFFLTGAGTASFAAYRAIKSKDPTAKILIVGDENRLSISFQIFTPIAMRLHSTY